MQFDGWAQSRKFSDGFTIEKRELPEDLSPKLSRIYLYHFTN